VDSGIDIAFEIFSQYNDRRAESAEGPTDEERENTNGEECKASFPAWPIERIIDIAGRLRNKNDIGAALDFMTRHHYQLENVGELFIPSTRDTVPSVSSSSFKYLNRGANIEVAREQV
jgi:hypothetical protein